MQFSYTYQVKVHTTTNSSSRAIGNFYLNVIGRKRDLKDVKLASPTLGFEANKTYTILIEKDKPIEEVNRVEIYFSENFVGDVLSVASVNVTVDFIEVNYLSNIDPR